MIEEILVNGVCAFMGTVGFAMMFNVPKRYYLSCGMTGAVGWLVYKGVHVYASSAVASFLAALMVGFTNADRADEVPDYHFPGIWDYPAGTGSRSVLYGVLSSYESVVYGGAERNGIH